MSALDIRMSNDQFKGIGVSIGCLNPQMSGIQNVVLVPDARMGSSASSIDFGKVKAGQSKTDSSVVLTNTGTDTLTVSSVDCTDTAFRAYLSKMKLAAGESVVLQGVFAPADTNAHSGKITITYDGYGSPFTLAVSGDGT